MLLFLHTAAGVNPVRRVPGSKEAAVPAAGAESVSQHGAGHRQHRNTHARPAHVLPATPCAVGTVSALASPPAISFVAALLWAVPAQAPEAVCPPHGPLSLSAAGSLRSPVRCTAKASGHPTLPDRLRGQHSAALRVLGHWQTCRPPRTTGIKESRPNIPPPPSCLQDCQQPRLPRKPTPPGQCVFERPTTPEGRYQG